MAVKMKARASHGESVESAAIRLWCQQELRRILYYLEFGESFLKAAALNVGPVVKRKRVTKRTRRRA